MLSKPIGRLVLTTELYDHHMSSKLELVIDLWVEVFLIMLLWLLEKIMLLFNFETCLI